MHEQVIIAMTIVAMCLIAGMTLNGIVGKVVDARRLRHEGRPATDGTEVRAIAERQAAIEDRLRVLERIATDRGSLLADEIESLRRETAALPQATRRDEVTAQ